MQIHVCRYLLSPLAFQVQLCPAEMGGRVRDQMHFRRIDYLDILKICKELDSKKF